MKRLFLLFMSLLLLAAFAACRDNAEVQVEETPTSAPAATPAPEPAEPPEEPDELKPEDNNADDDLAAEQDEADIASQIIGEWYMISTSSPTAARILEYGIREERHFLEGGYGAVIWYTPSSGRYEVHTLTWSVRDDFLYTIIVDFNSEVISEYLGESVARHSQSMLYLTFRQRFSVEDDIKTLEAGQVYASYRRINDN